MKKSLAPGKLACGYEAHNEAERLRQKLPTFPILGLQEKVWGRRYRIKFVGPQGTPFASEVFELDIQIVDGYPFLPPNVRFRNAYRIFHPNVCSESGGICLDILNDANSWSPTIGLEKLVMSVMSLLAAPCIDHGLNWDAVHLLRKDQGAYEARAAKVCRLRGPSWLPSAPRGCDEDSTSSDEDTSSAHSDEVVPCDPVLDEVTTQHHNNQENNFSDPDLSDQEVFANRCYTVVANRPRLSTPRVPPRQAVLSINALQALGSSPRWRVPTGRDTKSRQNQQEDLSAHSSSASSSTRGSSPVWRIRQRQGSPISSRQNVDIDVLTAHSSSASSYSDTTIVSATRSCKVSL